MDILARELQNDDHDPKPNVGRFFSCSISTNLSWPQEMRIMTPNLVLKLPLSHLLQSNHQSKSQNVMCAH